MKVSEVRKIIFLAVIGAALVFTNAGTASAYTLQGNTWGAGGTTVTYSFDYSGYSYNEPSGPYSGSTTPVPGGWEAVIDQAFQVWAGSVNLNFVKAADTGDDFNAAGAGADIRIALHAFDGIYGTLAHGYYPPPNGTSAAGDVHFDVAEDWYVGFGAPGGAQIDLMTVAIHELGHSIGIGHSADPTAIMFPTYTAGTTQRTLGADDVAAGQITYGASTPEPEFYVLMLLCLGGYCFLPASESANKKSSRKLND